MYLQNKLNNKIYIFLCLNKLLLSLLKNRKVYKIIVRGL